MQPLGTVPRGELVSDPGSLSRWPGAHSPALSFLWPSTSSNVKRGMRRLFSVLDVSVKCVDIGSEFIDFLE